MKTFLKKGSLALVNGGYLTAGKDNAPVYNTEFNKAEKHAEYVVKLAEAAKGKDFQGKKADSFDDLKDSVARDLAVTSVIEHVAGPKKPKQTVSDNLYKEAMAFMSFEEGSDNADKINEFLQAFNVINEFEEFGLFFDEDISKLNKIYTMEEVVAAVTSMVDQLD